jgi:CRISPR type I-E-associated protein CasB/Cse2
MNQQTAPSLKDRCLATVDKLIKTCQDPAARSALRPLLMGIPEMQIRAMRYLPQNAPVNKDLLHLIAGLIAEYPCEQGSDLSFGASLRQLAKHPKINATGIERRLELLLQLDVKSLTQPLHGLIVQARGAKTLVDYGTLLYHLNCWDDTRKWVQLQWARDFWCPTEPTETQVPPQVNGTDQE